MYLKQEEDIYIITVLYTYMYNKSDSGLYNVPKYGNSSSCLDCIVLDKIMTFLILLSEHTCAYVYMYMYLYFSLLCVYVPTLNIVRFPAFMITSSHPTELAWSFGALSSRLEL
jgi:hypothetical protein